MKPRKQLFFHISVILYVLCPCVSMTALAQGVSAEADALPVASGEIALPKVDDAPPPVDPGVAESPAVMEIPVVTEVPVDKLPPPIITDSDDDEPTGPVPAKSPDISPGAASPPPETPAKPKEDKPAMDPLVFNAYQKMKSPRGTVQYLMETAAKQEYKKSIVTLDMTKLPEMSESEKEDLAYKLYNILLRLDNFRVHQLPDDPESDVYYILSKNENYRAIILRKGKTVWRFAPETVAYIPRFYEEIKGRPPTVTRELWVMKYMPEAMLSRFAGLMYVQWVMIGCFLVLGYFVYRIAPAVTSYLILIPMQNLRKDEKFVHLMRYALRPLGYLAMVYIWFAGVRYVQLPPQALKLIGWIVHPIGILLIMVAVLRMTDIFGQWLRNRMQKSQNKAGNALADLSTNALKVLFVCMGFIAVAQVYGFSAIGILSGMGIGGIAVALAAQNTVANFFGSLMILMDRPFSVGDYIIADKIEGVVETIGLRSTRIRTFYNSLIVIPNSVLAAATVDNMERRYFRRYKTTLTIQYGTPVEKLDAFCTRVTELIMSYPTSKKTGVQVYVIDLGAYSINVLLNCHFAAGNANEEYEARQTLNFDILRLAAELGIVFASPGDRQVQMKDTASQQPLEK